MSDAPQQAEPDLHAIFGIDGEVEGPADAISVERALEQEDFETADGPRVLTRPARVLVP